MDGLITSAANPIVKRVRALADRKQRRATGHFVVEGMQPVWRAVESGWSVQALVIAPELLRTPAALSMVEQQRDAGVPVSTVSAELFTRMSERDGPAGVLAIVAARWTDLAMVDATAPVVALHRVHNPGNLGTVIRTADAAGFGAVILLDDCADPFAPAAVKASMGSVFAVPVVPRTRPDELFDWAGERGVTVVAATGSATENHWDASYPAATAVLMGNEGDGLPDEVAARADRQVRIPMTGTAESLNLSVATALMLYEVRRQQI